MHQTGLVVTLAVLACLNAPVARGQSGQAVNESMRASGHASASAAHSVVASGQVTSAVMAVPLSVGGAVLSAAGGVSAAAARDSTRAAAAPIGTPLQITNVTVTVMPPNEALKKKEANKP